MIHTHTVDGLTDGGLCRLLLRRVKLVHTFHFGNYPHARNRLLWMERIFSRLADRLFAVGDVQQGQIRSVLRLARRCESTRSETACRCRRAPSIVRFGRRSARASACRRDDRDVHRAERAARICCGRRQSSVTPGHDNVLFVVVGDGPLRPRLEARRRELRSRGRR